MKMSAKNRINLWAVKRHSVEERKTKADIRLFSGKPKPIKSFFDALPGFLKAADLKKLVMDMINARKRGKGIIWMMGAHPLKVGLSPVINELIRTGYITHLALNGAGVIHDIEIAFWGKTSEEVAETLVDGSFGMVRETPVYLAEALAVSGDDVGIGKAVGKYIMDNKPKYVMYSVLAQAYRKRVPVTVHIGIGTDTICQHPEFDGALWGEKSHLDFKILSENIKSINRGGVIINLGSAVILPEVFLKALTVARNIFGELSDFSAANFDMIQHYRPNENVVNRPTIGGGKRYSFTGHHEIMLPLLGAALKSLKR
jgi:hypothetical protein